MDQLPAPGLIPAHAGKTLFQQAEQIRVGAHPRSRGENLGGLVENRARQGSSPLTRGKPRKRGAGQDRRRLIPAHAGKTARERDADGGVGAHPRSRGENDYHEHMSALTSGSSPLTRGKRVSRVVDLIDPGLIPAHAGKTHHVTVDATGTRAHPRSRGENTPISTDVTNGSGSSPLTRGKPQMSFLSVGEFGLIPAHAGKTGSRCGRRGSARAHPRSRGENSLYRADLSNNCGSSPLTRGKPSVPPLALIVAGLIPAHAGKTWPARPHS